ncbi:MAG: hypothetical protein KAG37_02720, partial [Flavobacteriales bacterium]|nr:hypothetical protein [Flavobacteriales bacterium]
MTYEYPVWYIFVSVIIAGLLSFLMYRKNIKTSWEYTLMAFFRFLSLLVILIAIGDVTMFSSFESNNKRKLIV